MASDANMIEFDVSLESPLLIWEAEVELLRKVLSVSEQLLEDHIINQRIRASASEKIALSKIESKKARYDVHCEYQADLQNMEEIFRLFFERHFRNHFLVALCSIWESGLQESANYLSQKRHIKNKCHIGEKGRLSTNEYLVTFFEKYLNIEIYANCDDRKTVESAYKIRNIIAHNNSIIKTNHKTQQSKIVTFIIYNKQQTELCKKYLPLEERDRKLESGIIILTPPYLAKIFDIVNRVFEIINGEICKEG